MDELYDEHDRPARLVQLIEANRLTAPERVDAGRVLGRMSDPRPGVGLRADGLPDIVWCRVPAGPFTMGSSDNESAAWTDEGPQHCNESLTQDYLIGRYLVTQAQFGPFVAAGGYVERRYWTQTGWQWREREGWAGPASYGDPFDLGNHPAVGVSWYEAAAYCAWLTERLKVTGCSLQVWGNGQVAAHNLQPETCSVRLPSEVQWEKAARGDDGRRYPWGSQPDPERANYADTGIGTTSAVGCFPAGASVYGLEDASGNVWEWCRTKWEGSYEDYRGDDDPEGDGRRLLRGGSFAVDAGAVRCAYRGWSDPDRRFEMIGFRVVVSC